MTYKLPFSAIFLTYQTTGTAQATTAPPAGDTQMLTKHENNAPPPYTVQFNHPAPVSGPAFTYTQAAAPANTDPIKRSRFF